MAGKTKSQKKKALDMRSKMYLVLALCSVMLLVSVGISLVLIGGIDLGGADAQSVSAVDSASMVVESGYNKEENTIDTQAYTSTILEQAADAGVNRNEDSCVKRLPPHPALRGHLPPRGKALGESLLRQQMCLLRAGRRAMYRKRRRRWRAGS